MTWGGAQCPSGKHCFGDKHRADLHLTNARKMHSNYGGEVYRCRLCSNFHIGRSRKEMRRDRRRGKTFRR